MTAAKILVRNYRGAQAGVAAMFQADAAKLAASGYYPTSQTWAPGSYGCGAFLLAVVLCFVLIGFIVFIYMLLVKPDGTLSVTYEFRGSAQQTAEKTCPRCAEHVKAAAAVCRFCGYEFDPATLTAASPSLRAAPPSCPIDPFALARKGRPLLHQELSALSDAALRRLAADCAMDPNGFVQKWPRDSLIQHIESEAMIHIRLEGAP